MLLGSFDAACALHFLQRKYPLIAGYLRLQWVALGEPPPPRLDAKRIHLYCSSACTAPKLLPGIFRSGLSSYVQPA